MARIDTEMSNVPYYALPMALVLAISAIPRAIVIAREVQKLHAFLARPTGDVRPGPGHFEVMATGDGLTNLGTSTSTPKSESSEPTGAPTLTTEPAVLQIVNGPRIRIASGANMRIERFEGAKRRRLDATTTESGRMRVTHSFDVPANKRFWLECILPEPSALAHDAAYRQSGIVDVLPIGGDYIAMGSPAGPPNMVTSVILGAFVSAIIGFFVGLMTTMLWRTGCRSGKFPVPTAALVDTACIAIVFATMGMHVGAAQMRPSTMMKLRQMGQFP